MSSLKELHFCLDYSHNSSYSTCDMSDICKQLLTCPINHTIEVAFQDRNCEFPTLSLTISSKVECLDLSWLTLEPDFTQCEISNCLKRLKLNSCKIPDDASTALVHFLQSPQCVLEEIILLLPDPYYYDTCSINKLVQETGSNCMLKYCALRCQDDSIVQHLVAGLKESERKSSLETLIVLCEYHVKNNCEHCDELIRVVNEHNTISLLRLSSKFEEFVRKHDIRENLNIEYFNYYI